VRGVRSRLLNTEAVRNGASRPVPALDAERLLCDEKEGRRRNTSERTRGAETRRCRAAAIQPRSSTHRSRSLWLTGPVLPLLPTVALGKNSAVAGMATSPSSKLFRNAEKPIQSGSGERVEPRRRRRAIFARGDGLVQQCPNFLAGDVARPPGFAQSVAHFVCRCSKEFRFQGVEQRR